MSFLKEKLLKAQQRQKVNRVHNPQPLYQLQTIDNVECRRPQLNHRRFNNFIDILQL